MYHCSTRGDKIVTYKTLMNENLNKFLISDYFSIGYLPNTFCVLTYLSKNQEPGVMRGMYVIMYSMEVQST